jgi:hypothetical protein
MDQAKSKLYWDNPLLDPEFVADLITIITPYATSSAVRELFERVKPPQGLQLITSWKSDSLLSGVSDPEVYRVVEEYGGRLYLHDRIHIKLYVCSSHHAVLSTGNLTRNGLGFSASPNIEGSSVVRLDSEDWKRISRLFSESRRVTEEIYEMATEFCEHHRKAPEKTPAFELPRPVETEANFSWLSLPATKHPDALWRAYEMIDQISEPEELARVSHDLDLYEIPPGLGEEAFHEILGSAFLRHPFTKKLTGWLQTEGQAYFGAVKVWLQQNCSDKPTPYRWELTPATQALFAWLGFYNQKITWSRPNHSQLLKWENP